MTDVKGYEDLRVQDKQRILSQGLGPARQETVPLILSCIRATSAPLSMVQACLTMFALAWKIRFGE
jgi:hypothetical protein